MARYSRRTALQLGTAVAGILAGCSGDGGSSDPDAGTDSYGITVRNRRDEEHDVAVVAQPIDGDPVFEQTVTAVPDEPKSWDEVLTEPGQTQVKAILVELDGEYSERLTRASNYVTVGGEGAPAVADVVVSVYGQEVVQQDSPLTAVEVSIGDES